MPLITCPDCEKQVSDRAPTCIHCGAPLLEINQTKSSSALESAGVVSSSESVQSSTKGKLVSFNHDTGGGILKNESSGSYIHYNVEDVVGGKSLLGYSGATVRYEVSTEGKLTIFHPDTDQSPTSVSYDQTSGELKRDPSIIPVNEEIKKTAAPSDEKITKYIWQVVCIVILVGYWISKGTPNPMLFFSSSEAKKECLGLANANKGSMMILDDAEIEASESWIKDGKRVVRLTQLSDGKLRTIMCLYGNGMVEIPSMVEQGRWR